MPKFITVTVEKWITPPQAGSIASEFRAAAQEVREIANKVRNKGEMIRPGWVCPVKDIFFSHFDPCPGELDSFAQQLDAAADDIRNTKVKIYVEEEIEVQDIS